MTHAQGVPLVVGLTGGSLWQVLGGQSVPGRMRSGAAMHLPVDVVQVQGLDVTAYFVNALVARRAGLPGWRSATIAMNGQLLHGRRIGNRAHPGDGLIDVYEARLDLRELMKVVRRARNGAHLPHPGISERRVGAVTLIFDRPRTIWLDGDRVGRSAELRLRTLTDRLTVVL